MTTILPQHWIDQKNYWENTISIARLEGQEPSRHARQQLRLANSVIRNWYK
tara:strand:- start:1147 stop:1299 length:153 start_codon:yes stop_codon:yes gene_type:complete